MRRLTNLRISESDTGTKVEVAGHDISESVTEVALMIGRDGVAEAQIVTHSKLDLEVMAEITVVGDKPSDAAADWLRSIDLEEFKASLRMGMATDPVDAVFARLLVIAEDQA